MDVKQIIVMRTKYPDGKGGTRGLRTGKMMAQAAHASMLFLVARIKPIEWEYDENGEYAWLSSLGEFSLPESQWLEGKFTKICVGVETEEELMDVYKKAKALCLETHLVTDAGKTEFDGVPTPTCLAIGPDYSENIDKVTKDLKLL